MKSKVISLLFCITMFFTGCDLDTQPYQTKDVDQIKPEELESLTLGTYAQLKKGNGLQHRWHYFGEYRADNICQGSASTDALTNIHHFRRLTDNYHDAGYWQDCYVGIVNINTCLGVAQEGATPEVDHVIGENYFLRAYHYFLLCAVFGQPYSNNPTQNLGIPLKLTADPDDYPARSTVAEVYDQVIRDLEEAIRLMELQTSTQVHKNSCYATKEAAMAFLSRVYLCMGETNNAYYRLAGEMADAVIKSGYYSLEQGERYAKYPQHVPEENSETIFAARNVKDIDHAPWSAIGCMYSTIDNMGYGEIFASSTYLDLLERYPQDLRNRFIQKKTLANGGKWFIYNKLQSDGKYNYSKVYVEENENGEYELIDEEGEYLSTTAVAEPKYGGVDYYVIEADGKKYYGRVEDATETFRLGHPVYYILKCSYQEQQAQLYSPIAFRLAEMYLTRAEANCVNGDEQAALDDINIIRERAGIPKWTKDTNPADGYVTVPPSDEKTILDLVRDERRLELAYEACRYLDIMRIRGTIDRRYPGHHNDVSPFHGQIPYNSDIVSEYIPQRELDAYPTELQQNP